MTKKLAPVLAGLVAFILYWPTLDFPLIYDTLLHIRIAGNLDYVTVWLPTEAFGFYRPLTFLPLLVTKSLFGEYPNWFLHGMNVVQHALNAGLLAWLVLRLGGGGWRAALAGALFAVFPFSYQAVAVYGHNVHPALAGLMLLGCHGWLSAEKSRKWLIFVFIIFILGLLTHESAILLGPFLFLITLVRAGADGVLPASRLSLADIITILKQQTWPMIFCGLGVLYVGGYQLLPISRAPQAAADAASNLHWFYILQAGAYPLAGLARWIPASWGGWFTALIVVATVAFVLLRWRAAWRWLLLGFGWWALASLLIGLALPSDYLLNGPRLLYLSSVGLALAWSGLIVGEVPPFKKVATLVGATFALLVLIQNGSFVQARLTDYDMLTTSVDVINHDFPPNRDLLLVNHPQWLARPPDTYVFGAEFVQQLGDYLFIEEWVNANVSPRKVLAVREDALLADFGYGYGIHQQHGWGDFSAETHPLGTDIVITSYAEDGPVPVLVGSIEPFDSPSKLATVGPYLLHRAVASRCQGVLTVSTIWFFNSAAPSTLSAFAQVLENGVLIDQIDRPLAGLTAERINLQPGWSIADERQFTNTTGDTVLIGLYDFVTGERVPMEGETADSQKQISDNAFAIPISECAEN